MAVFYFDLLSPDFNPLKTMHKLFCIKVQFVLHQDTFNLSYKN